MVIRRPVVAGSFYESEPAALRSQIESCFLGGLGPTKKPVVVRGGEAKISALVCPHAGYVFSGGVAAHSYFHLGKDGGPLTFIIIGPNHYGIGAGVAIQTKGVWQTPLGEVEIDEELGNQILEGSQHAEADSTAHEHEHSIEVQLPFLQYLFGDDFTFVPISLMLQAREVAEDLGNSIVRALAKKKAVVIASSDFTHYETQEAASSKDKKALLAMEQMNASVFLSTIVSHDISACGYGAVATAIEVAAKSDARRCEILKYATSGDVTGDRLQVVGYAAAKFTL